MASHHVLQLCQVTKASFICQSNPNPEIVRLALREGLSVVAVSGFEVRMALEMGFPGRRVFFNGNGKQRWEMRLAAERGCVMNVDSVFNARQLVEVVRGQVGAAVLEVTVRLNVDIDTQVHPYLRTGTALVAEQRDFFQSITALLPQFPNTPSLVW